MSDIEPDDDNSLDINSDDDNEDDIQIHTDDDDDDVDIPKPVVENDDDDNLDDSNSNIINSTNNNDPGSHDDDDDDDIDDDDDDDDDDDNDDAESSKIKNIKENIEHYHNEHDLKSFEQIKPFLNIKRNSNNMITDEYHKTIPILTKFEVTKIIGMRTVQLDNGLAPFISVPSNIIDSSIIAKMELQQKKIPFIVKRPISYNYFEYWYLHDLEYIE